MLFAVLSVGAGGSQSTRRSDIWGARHSRTAPALLQRDPERRADAELDAADRRLTDVRHAFVSVHSNVLAALEALIAGDEAAATQASRLSEPARLQAAERVETHAATLSLLAESASEAHVAETLAAAAARTPVIADRVRAGQPGLPQPPTDRPTITAPAPIQPTPTSLSATPAATATPTPQASRRASVRRRRQVLRTDDRLTARASPLLPDCHPQQ